MDFAGLERCEFAIFHGGSHKIVSENLIAPSPRSALQQCMKLEKLIVEFKTENSHVRQLQKVILAPGMMESRCRSYRLLWKHVGVATAAVGE
ncbi:hypothetical protein AVEN_13878-1 [Araneus ventricosus]|uniref:Uncharacterized protein n=1 Tax=Araneus ventricosus TaxID=182803 RepID=A0A4Y2M661_ARAVE|nr:hypothetical protein AVEN_13878-1 [Araneus ventricosus]